FGVSLAGMHVTQIEKCARMMNWQQNAVADRDVADVEVSAPLSLAVETRGDFAVGSHAERADEGGNGPRNFFAEVQRTVAGGAAWAMRMAEDFGRIIRRQFGPAGRFSQWSAAGTDGDPGVIFDDDVFDNDGQHVAALSAFQEYRTAD